MNLVDLVQRDTPLTQRRGEWWGCCPFHAEKTPSFSVNEEKQVFSCFGCGKAGDAITYLRATRGLSFRDACKAIGRELPESEKEKAARERRVRERLVQEYAAWCRAEDRADVDRYHQIRQAIETAEIAYRAVTRRPDLYTDAQRVWWERRLSTLYAAQLHAELAMAEGLLVCETPTYQRSRFQRWHEERRCDG